MPRELSWIPTLVLLAAVAAPAAALTVVVPDDHPTIQAAIDSGADVIRVRGGLVPERLTLTHDVTIEPRSPESAPYGGVWEVTPMIQSLEVHSESGGGSYSPRFSVHGVRFLGEVRLVSNRGYRFESCRFDSGFTDHNSSGQAWNTVSVRNCMFIGDVRVTGAVQFVANEVIGGSARIFSDGSHDISYNYITGPATAGLELYLSDSDGPIAMNTIRGTTDGIRFLRRPFSTSRTLLNDIRDCSGDGIVYVATSAPVPVIMTCDYNTIERCGGAGIVIRGSDEDDYHGARLTGNVIRQTGLGGIDLPRTIVYEARGNTILDAGADGFRAWLVDSFETNVIGRSGGTGLRIEEEYYQVSGNTIFSNAGPGIHFSGGGLSVLMARNISVFNGGPGLLFEATCPPEYCGPPDLSCNNWFGNAGGAVIGALPGTTDVSVHPQFCDLANADVRLSQSSPLLAAPGCGLIGALGVGCGPITGVGTMEEGAPVGFRAWPVPSRGAVAFSLPASLEPTEIEVFDVTGARRWQAAIPAGVTAAQWDRRENTGRTAPPGVYFARVLRGGAEIARVKVVLTE